jgi:hypothetical protein
VDVEEQRAGSTSRVEAHEGKKTAMSATVISSRDRAVLRAVAAGRCAVSPTLSTTACPCLTIDGIGCCDQFTGTRLATAGLIAYAPGSVTLTETGRALLLAA